jgi:hypothetical protein
MTINTRQDNAGKVTSFHKKLNIFRENLAQEQLNRKSGVREMIRGFKNSRQSETNRSRQELAQDANLRKIEVDKIRDTTGQTLKEMKTNRVTQNGNMRKVLSHSVTKTKSEVKNLKNRKRSLQNSPRPARTSAEKKIGVEPVPQKLADNIEAKLMTIISENPDGITLAKVAEKLGVYPVVLGRIANRLIADGKIRKEDKTYTRVKS